MLSSTSKKGLLLLYLLLQTKLTYYSTLEEDKKPVEAKFSDKPEIPRRPKKPQPAESNSNGETNGDAVDTVDAEHKGVKRPHTEDGGQPLKKVKITPSGAEIVDLDQNEGHASGGAIVIDD
jgi:ubiquitin-like 1-activating enzyme E1 B